jgi:hypothetical protein
MGQARREGAVGGARQGLRKRKLEKKLVSEEELA